MTSEAKSNKRQIKTTAIKVRCLRATKLGVLRVTENTQKQFKNKQRKAPKKFRKKKKTTEYLQNTLLNIR